LINLGCSGLKIRDTLFLFKNWPIINIYNGFIDNNIEKVMYLKMSKLALLVFFISANISLAWENVPVLLKGKINELKTGDIIGVEIEFRTKDGKRIKTQSNSKYGNYEQLLNAGELYEVVFTGSDIVRKIDTVQIYNFTKYLHKEKNFQVQRLSQSIEFTNFFIKKKKKSEVSPELKELLTDLQNLMKFNRAVNFEISVNAYDTYRSYPEVKVEQADKKAKKSKKKTTQPTASTTKKPDPDPSLVKTLVDERTQVVNSLLADASWKRYIKRISVKADYSLGAPLPEGTKYPGENLRIIVSSLDSAMDK